MADYLFPFEHEHPITSPYGPRGSGFHEGTDFGWTPQEGQSFPVLATAPGTIVYVADESAYGGGLVVNIDHPEGTKSKYFHLDHWTVEMGQEVAAGELIAMSGDSGVPGQPHLHFQLHEPAGNPIDPMSVLTWPDETLTEEEVLEVPNYACALLRNEFAQTFVHNGITRRYILNQDGLNVLVGSGLCNPNIQDLPAVYIDSIPWDMNDPYYPSNPRGRMVGMVDRSELDDTAASERYGGDRQE
jgi:hypothetical protein